MDCFERNKWGARCKALGGIMDAVVYRVASATTLLEHHFFPSMSLLHCTALLREYYIENEPCARLVQLFSAIVKGGTESWLKDQSVDLFSFSHWFLDLFYFIGKKKKKGRNHVHIYRIKSCLLPPLLPLTVCLIGLSGRRKIKIRLLLLRCSLFFLLLCGRRLRRRRRRRSCAPPFEAHILSSTLASNSALTAIRTAVVSQSDWQLSLLLLISSHPPQTVRKQQFCLKLLIYLIAFLISHTV